MSETINNIHVSNNTNTASLTPHPFFDFLLIGGSSLLFYLFFISVPALNQFTNATNINYKLVVFLGYVVNYPHFAYSYQIFYSSYFNKISDKKYPIDLRVRHIFAGIIVPIFIILYSFYFVIAENAAMLGYMTNAMLFLVGWHYVKQGFGSLVVLSALNKFYYSKIERNLLFSNAYIIWLLSWVSANIYLNKYDFWGIAYYTFNFPGFIKTILWYVALVVGIIICMTFLIRYIKTCRLPPINGIIAYVSASYLWLVVGTHNPLYFYWIPFFHSLQYLPFVYRYKKEQAKEKHVDNSAIKKSNIIFAIAGVILGSLGFYIIPTFLDSYVNYNNAVFNSFLFIFLFNIFINIHHYFMDNAIWRKNNPEMKGIFFLQNS